MFYQRTALSRNKAAMLTKGVPEDRMTPEEEIKDPYILEFLALKDEYSESQLEEALIRHLESFLLKALRQFYFIHILSRFRNWLKHVIVPGFSLRKMVGYSAPHRCGSLASLRRRAGFAGFLHG